MIIDIFKDKSYFENLKDFNSGIIKASENLKYNIPDHEYDLENDVISEWFDPKKIKRMPTSRTYPLPAKEQFRDEYSLILYNANYLALFLLPILYKENRNILIEDVGAGVGHLLVYLHYVGFRNFHVKENFTQISKKSLDIIMEYFKIPYLLNDTTLKAEVIHNSGVPEPSCLVFTDKTELAICYTNRTIEEWASKYWKEKNFVFLCKDYDDFAFAYCRKDKYEEFKEKLKPYVTTI